MSKGIQFKNEKEEKVYPNPYFPVGSIFLSVVDTNPSKWFGGTWVKMTGGFLYGAVSSVGTGNGTGTATNNHALTVEQIPAHNHQHDSSIWSQSEGYGSVNVGSVSTANKANLMSSRTTEVGGSQGHSHNIPYIGVWIWKRTA